MSTALEPEYNAVIRAKFDNKADSSEPAYVVIYPPRLVGNIWECNVDIERSGSTDQAYVFGAHPFQAIYEAFKLVRIKLNDGSGNYFIGLDSLKMVLPMCAPFEYGEKFQDEIEAHMKGRKMAEEARLAAGRDD